MIDKSLSVPIYVQLQEMLIQEVRDGKLKPGDQVPSEQELAARFTISRMTARKALDGIVSSGLLFRQRGKGTFVTQNFMSYNLSTIMSFSSTLKALGYDVTTKVLNQEVIPASQLIVEKLKLPYGSQVVLIKRLRYIDNKPAAIHTSYLGYPEFADILQMDLSQISLLSVVEKVGRVRISYSQDSVQAGIATSEEVSLLQIHPGSPVLIVKGVAFSDNGLPLRFTHAVYRADVFTLVVTNTGSQGTSLIAKDL